MEMSEENDSAEELRRRLESEEEELKRRAESGDIQAAERLAMYRRWDRYEAEEKASSEPKFTDASIPSQAWNMLDD